MPFTPFHLGPGLLAKALLPRRVSFVGFAASQVAIDFEVLVRLLNRDPLLHGPVHTLVVAIPLGLVTGGIAGAALGRFFPRTAGANETFRHEARLGSGMLGGILGGATHPLLDGLMHVDVYPFWPFHYGNPLLHLVSLRSLSLGCVVAGALGIVLWFANSSRRRRLASRTVTHFGGPTR